MLQNTRRTDDYTRELIFLYDEAAVNIEKEIEALFARFARDNGLTEEAARQLPFAARPVHCRWSEASGGGFHGTAPRKAW